MASLNLTTIRFEPAELRALGRFLDQRTRGRDLLTMARETTLSQSSLQQRIAGGTSESLHGMKTWVFVALADLAGENPHRMARTFGFDLPVKVVEAATERIHARLERQRQEAERRLGAQRDIPTHDPGPYRDPATGRPDDLERAAHALALANGDVQRARLILEVVQ